MITTLPMPVYPILLIFLVSIRGMVGNPLVGSASLGCWTGH